MLAPLGLTGGKARATVLWSQVRLLGRLATWADSDSRAWMPVSHVRMDSQPPLSRARESESCRGAGRAQRASDTTMLLCHGTPNHRPLCAGRGLAPEHLENEICASSRTAMPASPNLLRDVQTLLSGLGATMGFSAKVTP